MISWCHIGVTPVLRTKWICPNCSELSPTRHWSVGRHMMRKHAGMGEPISINTYQTRAQMIRSGIFKPPSPTSFNNPTKFSPRMDDSNHYWKGDNSGSARHTAPTNYFKGFSVAQDGYIGEETRRRESPPPSKKGGILDESFELFRRTLEMK